jgi:hypothetical protein
MEAIILYHLLMIIFPILMCFSEEINHACDPLEVFETLDEV